MSDDQVRADIAFIRAALEQGRAYAAGGGQDMIAWGLLVAAGYLGTWAWVMRQSSVTPTIVWSLVLVAGWLFSLRRVIRRIPTRSPPVVRRPTVAALRSLWLGIGLCLTLAGVAGILGHGFGRGGLDAFAAGLLGVGFFTSATLSGLGWMRWVALCWWAGELAALALRDRIEVLPLDAALFLLLLAGPGLALMRRPASQP